MLECLAAASPTALFVGAKEKEEMEKWAWSTGRRENARGLAWTGCGVNVDNNI